MHEARCMIGHDKETVTVALYFRAVTYAYRPLLHRYSLALAYFLISSCTLKFSVSLVGYLIRNTWCFCLRSRKS